MTFLSGFAESFIDARNKKMEREQQQEDTQFKYKMDALVKLREKREAKSEKETQLASQAKMLSQQFGDDTFATTAMQELKLGVSPETIQERIGKGYYQKNTDYKAPTQTLKVPNGVSNPMPTEVQYDTGMDATDPKRAELNKTVNKRIDDIDPTLRKSTIADQDQLTATGDGKGAYVFKPTNEIKIGDMNDSYWALYQAKQSGDPTRIRNAQAQVEINQRVETERARNQARANGKNVDTYFSVNPDGSLGPQLPGEVREDGLYNVSDPMNPQKVSGPVRRMSDDDVKRYNSLVDDFGKASKDYNANAESFVSALNASQQMTQILHNDPQAATMASKGLGLIESLSGEAQAGYKAILGIEQTISQKTASGKIEGIEKDIMDHAKAVDNFLKNGGVLSDANQQKAVNAAKYNSLRMQTAYQIAQATSTDGKVSNQDLANALEIIGNSSDPKQILPALNAQMQGAFLKLQSSQATLNRNPSVDDFEKRYGVKTGLKGKRIGEIIQGTELPPEQKQMLMKYLGGITRQYSQGQADTFQSVQEQNAQQGYQDPAVKSEAAPVEIKSKEDFDKLPSGTKFKAPDGSVRRKP